MSADIGHAGNGDLALVPGASTVWPIASERLLLDVDSRVCVGAGAEAAAPALRAVLRTAGNLPLPPTDDAGAAVFVGISDEQPAGGYSLVIDTDHLALVGGDLDGLLAGVQTIRQLLPSDQLRAPTDVPATAGGGPLRVVSLPAVRITDAPAFEWRGLLVDVARHLLPLADLLRIVDAAALHKLNRLHLHLTDDQGWRLPVPGWPRLTEVGDWRRRSAAGHDSENRLDDQPHGGHYRAGELALLVEYAAERGITVVPEIDLPGHMVAAIAAYPELGCYPDRQVTVRERWGISDDVLAPTEEALSFLRDVLDAVCDLFPSPWVHLGGDECPTTQWVSSPVAQARLVELGLDEPAHFQRWFATELAAHLATRGRTAVFWHEVLESGVPEGAVVMSWLEQSNGVTAARRGHEVVMAPESRTYLDHYQRDPATHPDEPLAIGGLTTWRDTLALVPVPPELAAEPGAAARIVGVQACLWTEYVATGAYAAYLLFPRLCALAEVGWSGPGTDPDEFAGRLAAHLSRLDALGLPHAALDD
jgi:hexosaminidase